MFRFLKRYSTLLLEKPLDRPRSKTLAALAALETRLQSSPIVEKPMPNATHLVENQLNFIHTCLFSDRIDEAERSFNRLWWSNNVELKTLFDVKLVHSFIECHLDSERLSLSTMTEIGVSRADALSLPPASHLQRALLWKKRIPEFGLAPNARTYGLFLLYYLEKGMHQEALGVIASLKEAKIPLDDLYLLDLFNGKDSKAHLDFILQESGSETSSSLSDHMSALFKSAVQESEELRETFKPNLDPELVALKNTQLLQSQVGSVAILKKVLDQLQEIGDMSSYNRQTWLEEQSVALAREVFESSQTGEHTPIPMSFQVMQEWIKNLGSALKSRIEMADYPVDACSQIIQQLTPERVALITVSHFFNEPFLLKMSKGGAALTSDEDCEVHTRVMIKNLSKSVFQQYDETLAKKTRPGKTGLDRALHALSEDQEIFDETTRQMMKTVYQKDSELNEKWIPKWDDKNLLQVGAWLLSVLSEVGTIEIQSTEGPTYPLRRMKYDQEGWFVAFHPKLFDLVSRACYNVEAWQLPMLTRPQPWITIFKGGYLHHKTEMMRIHQNREHLKLLEEADRLNHLNAVQRSLDVLGSTAWQINQKVFRVAAEVWNSGQQAPYMPILSETAGQSGKLEGESVSEWKARRKLLREKMSQRCDTNYKLEIAKAFLGETLYFPHNLDFRGRAYPVPPHMNHLGSDLCRGLLVFGNKKPLGEQGLYWLKIQVSNLAGCDKVSHADRIAFTESHLNDIMDSADHPLSGKRWWLFGEDAWQLLAACFELTAALRHPDPLLYESSLPIHQDGSCNGLQHYAALGGDPAGAKSVNLISSTHPNDVYADVAAVVRQKVDLDVAKGLPAAVKIMPLISRKLVKQTVMTSSYGVTFIGGKDQVAARLKELTEDLHNPLIMSEPERNECATYVVKIIFESLGSLFSGAQSLQKWLNVAAKVVASTVNKAHLHPDILEESEAIQGILLTCESAEDVCDTNDLLDAAETDTEMSLEEDEDTIDLLNAPSRHVCTNESVSSKKKSTVLWTTPLGLPVSQPYRTVNRYKVNTTLQSFEVRERRPDNPVDGRKQSTAFPPNFIHSLDASHMMLSALECQKKGIEFASVHDSYWTHACDVPLMNSLLREQFVKLHKSNVLEHLRQELLVRFKHFKIYKSVVVQDQETLLKLKAYYQSKGKPFPIRKKGRLVHYWESFDLAPLPSKGSLDLDCVLNSPYFFH